MYDLLRPYLIIVNLGFFAWFVVLQYFRFKPTGLACAGDFLLPKNVKVENAPKGEEIEESVDYPENYATVYLGE